jgi:hypothetical protein
MRHLRLESTFSPIAGNENRAIQLIEEQFPGRKAAAAAISGALERKSISCARTGIVREGFCFHPGGEDPSLDNP